jgi:hypothetical protein
LNEVIKNAAKKTEDKLASQISSLTRLKYAEIKEMFPEPSCVKKLAELMEIVKSAEDKDLKISKIIKNSENFAGIIMTLLSKLV